MKRVTSPESALASLRMMATVAFVVKKVILPKNVQTRKSQDRAATVGRKDTVLPNVKHHACCLTKVFLT